MAEKISRFESMACREVVRGRKIAVVLRLIVEKVVRGLIVARCVTCCRKVVRGPKIAVVLRLLARRQRGRRGGEGGGSTTVPSSPDEGALAAGSSYQSIKEESRYVYIPGIDYPYTQKVYVYVSYLGFVCFARFFACFLFVFVCRGG